MKAYDLSYQIDHSTFSLTKSTKERRLICKREDNYSNDRIIMVSGSIDDVLKVVGLIVEKLLNEIHTEEGDEADPRMKVRLVVPNGSCGSIIGKGGSIIKSFIEESQAGIKISPLDNNFHGLNDRLVTVTGSLEVQMQAIDLVLTKLSDDPHYSQSVHTPFSFGVAYNSMNYGQPNGVAG